MKTLWKQQVPLHPTFEKLNRSLSEDWFLLPFELRLQRAHALALEKARILTPAEREALVHAVDAIEVEHAGSAAPESTAEDIHTWIEEQLTERVGEAGKKIHTARSRNDQVATLLTLFCIDAGDRLSTRLGDATRVACARAVDWKNLEMPLWTHTQFAAPGSVGAWMLRYAAAWARQTRALRGLTAQWRRACPLGSGAVAGSSIDLDRALQARELGFEGPSSSALYSTSTRDDCLELLATASQAALHLGSLATDVILFSQTPLRWTKYPPAFGTGSSMMPNKTNPDAMELLRGSCAGIQAAHVEVLLTLKNLPSGYNRDLQCLKPAVHDTVTTWTDLVDMASAFLPELDFDASALEASLGMGQIDATLRMEEAVTGGVTLREAHHRVATEIASGPTEAPKDAPASGGERRHGFGQYRTTGAASPKEVEAAAAAILAEL